MRLVRHDENGPVPGEKADPIVALFSDHPQEREYGRAYFREPPRF